MSIAEDLQWADTDPHGTEGRHAVNYRWPGGTCPIRLIARWRRDHDHRHLPASPRRGRWAE